MVEEDLVSGQGWISEDSSFYGDEDEQERLRDFCEEFDPQTYWSNYHKSSLNVLIARARPMPSQRLENPYQGNPYAWQLGESINDFAQRLPPASTPRSVCDWIWCANPYPEGQVNAYPSRVEELQKRGSTLLQQSFQARCNVQSQNKYHDKATLANILNQESEKLKTRINTLAEETNVLTGKWMLFPGLGDVTRTWKLVVEGTVNGRLGCSAKVATDDGKPHDRLICVYTKNYRDTHDVLRVLNELVAMGLIKHGRGVFYKSDPYTMLNIYGGNASDYGLQASIYSSQGMLHTANPVNVQPTPQKKESPLKPFCGYTDEMEID